jgi:hypothetical protein
MRGSVSSKIALQLQLGDFLKMILEAARKAGLIILSFSSYLWHYSILSRLLRHIRRYSHLREAIGTWRWEWLEVVGLHGLADYRGSEPVVAGQVSYNDWESVVSIYFNAQCAQTGLGKSVVSYQMPCPYGCSRKHYGQQEVSAVRIPCDQY